MSSSFRHIAIGGTSFCGSTITSYILGALPGVANIGESHWLVDGPHLTCSYCGEGCQVLSREFRSQLEADEQGWYSRIAARLGEPVLVSSDKSEQFWRRYDPEMDFDLVALYKPIELAAASHKRIMERQGRVFQVNQYLNQWAANYRKLLNLDNRGGKTFVDAQRLYDCVSQNMPQLARALGLDYAPDALEYWNRPFHTIGGNFNPMTLLSDNPGALAVRPIERHALTAEEVEACASHERANAVLEGLVHRSVAWERPALTDRKNS